MSGSDSVQAAESVTDAEEDEKIKYKSGKNERRKEEADPPQEQTKKLFIITQMLVQFIYRG